MAETPIRGACDADARQAEGREPRCLGGWSATAIVAGNMVGVGIFLLPALVARHTQATAPFLLLWAVGGLWALCGALCLAELGALLPRAGGEYVYIREAYGRPWAFLDGWLCLLVTFPGSIAVMSYLTWRYQAPTFFGDWLTAPWSRWALGPLELAPSWAHLFAVGQILGLTAVAHRSTRLSGSLQLGATGVPLILMLVAGAGGVALLAAPVAAGPVGAPPTWPPLGTLVLGLLPVYFAYAGWNAAAYVAGEIRTPSRTLPRALAAGTLLVTGAYLLVCLAYTRAMPVSAMVEEFNLGVAVARPLLGDVAGPLIDALILVAVLGTTNATIIAGARINLAMARDGLFFPAAGRLHPRHQTPTWSLWIQGGWAAVLVFVGNLEELLDYTVTIMLALNGLGVAAVMVLRRTRPDAVRPYRTWGYPVTPLLYLAITGLVLWASLQHAGISQLAGLGIGAAGLAVYYVALRHRPSPPPPPCHPPRSALSS